MVVRTHTISGSAKLRYALSHEWMHTLQNDAYTPETMAQLWWAEGSAEWAAQVMNPGTAFRDHKITEFYAKQRRCDLTQHSYDAQPFFFWSEQAFSADWVVAMAMGGRRFNSDPAGVAQTLPPDRWMDWAIAQADRTVTMPDGRPLPAQLEAEPLEISDSCEARLEAAPLSVQLREVSLPEGAASRLRIEANDVRVAIRKSGETDWQRLEPGTTFLDPPFETLELVAIMPSGRDMNVRLSMDNTDGGSCACHIGRWMEAPRAVAEDRMDGARDALAAAAQFLPPDKLAELREAQAKISGMNLEDKYHFRDETVELIAGDGGGDVSFRTRGPIINIRPGGGFSIEDPHVITSGDGERIEYFDYLHYGTWQVRDGILELDLESVRYRGVVEGPNSDGPQPIEGDGSSFTAASYIGGGGQWVTQCGAGQMTLLPKDERSRGPEKNAVLVRN